MTEDKIILRGSKGKGGGPRTPTEAPDTLQSTQLARVLDLVSEGEIDQYEDVFLDKTAISNFSGFEREFRVGTQNHTALFAEANFIEATSGVGVSVTQSGGPIPRAITDSNITRVLVTVQIPTLQIIESDGDIIGHSVSFQISLQFNGGGFAVVAQPTIRGKTSNSYSRTYNVNLQGATFPVDIRLTRTSADETSAKRQNTLNWTSFTTIIDENLRYPNSAIHFLEFNAQQFNSIPERRFLIR